MEQTQKTREESLWVTFELAVALANSEMQEFLESLSEPERARTESFIEQVDYFALSAQASDEGFDYTDGYCDATGLYSDKLVELIGITEVAS